MRYDAAYHDSGIARPSHEAKGRYLELLVDAVQAGRAWAQMVAEAEAQKAAAHTLGMFCRSLIRLMKSAPKAQTVAEARATHGLNSIEEWFLLEAEKNHAA